MFLVADFTFIGSKVITQELDQSVFKQAAYSSKTTNNQNGNTEYSMVLIPIIEDKESELIAFIENNVESSIDLSDDEDNSIGLFLEESEFFKNNFLKFKFHIRVIGRINDEQLGIGYSDGSCKKSTNQASYACYKLTEESDDGVCDDSLTNKKFLYEEYSGIIESGTNNIGELSGIKALVDNFSDKKYQVIISDSEYGLKCYREWYYTWKMNGFRTYSKKPIANKELIVETFDKIKNSGKIVFFKWVKGHNLDSFNEMCDQKAKEILEI